MARKRVFRGFSYPRAIAAGVVGLVLASPIAADGQKADRARASAACEQRGLIYSALRTELPPLRANGFVCLSPIYPRTYSTFSMETQGGLGGAGTLLTTLLVAALTATATWWAWGVVRRAFGPSTSYRAAGGSG